MKILLAEDTKDLNRAVSFALEHAGYVVNCAFDGEEAFIDLLCDSYDGIILDIMMPKKSGLQVLSDIRKRHIITPVLLLTAKTEIEDRVVGLDAGADDYLTKPFAMQELLARVRAMIRRDTRYTEECLQFHDLLLDASACSMAARNTIRLSMKEFELIRTLASCHETGCTSEYLLAHIWRNDQDALYDTVELYISYLKRKLKSIGSSIDIIRDQTNVYWLRERVEV